MDNINNDNNKITISMSLEQYLDNPTMTKNNSSLNLSLIRNGLDNRYDKLMNAVKQIKYTVYEKDTNTLWVHVLVPSESYKLNYDVVLEISRDGEILKNQYFKVFSNSPSFVYTYAYVFNLFDLLIPELENKYNKTVLTKEPMQKNYYKIISYEKSLYYAILYILSKNTYISELAKGAKKLNIKEFSEKILTDEDKIAEYTRKRKREQYLKKHDLGAVMADKMRKDAIKRERKMERLTGVSRTSSKPSASAKAKEKISGKAKVGASKRKITGKKKR